MRERLRKVRLHLPARIDCGRGTRPLHCIVSGLSETGARMTLAKDAGLPDEFVLVLTADGRSRRHCRVVQRDHCEVSVRFLPEKPAAK
jgi:PilZ domain-containing protein